MKLIICTVLTLLSATGIVCAQLQIRKQVGQTFGMASGRIERRFWIDLGKGNRLCLELEDQRDLEKFTNIDSLLMVFLADMKPFSDSLSDPLSWHLIDYVSDTTGKKKLRFQSFRPSASSYLLDQGEPAALRLEQDTISIVLIHREQAGARKELRQDRLSLYLNDYHELTNYITGGLNDKIKWLQQNMGRYWVHDKKVFRAEKDPSITATAPAGYVAPINDYLSTIIRMGIGNYKSSFAPSFGLGLGLHFSRASRIQSFNFYWQPLFLFRTNDKGHLQTYENEFLVVNISNDPKGPRKDQITNLAPSFSFGWLVRNQGDFFEKHTYKLFLGQLKIFNGAATLEPGMYFHDFFREVTPAINISIDL